MKKKASQLNIEKQKKDVSNKFNKGDGTGETKKRTLLDRILRFP